MLAQVEQVCWLPCRQLKLPVTEIDLAPYLLLHKLRLHLLFLQLKSDIAKQRAALQLANDAVNRSTLLAGSRSGGDVSARLPVLGFMGSMYWPP